MAIGFRQLVPEGCIPPEAGRDGAHRVPCPDGIGAVDRALIVRVDRVIVLVEVRMSNAVGITITERPGAQRFRAQIYRLFIIRMQGAVIPHIAHLLAAKQILCRLCLKIRINLWA